MVDSTQQLVRTPPSTIVEIPLLRKMKSRFVLAKVSSPRLPSMTISPSFGSSSSVIAAPHVPLTKALPSTTPLRMPYGCALISLYPLAKVIGACMIVVEAARSAGATIMHAPITFAKGYNEISAHPYGILKGVVDGNAFVKGTWGAAITEELDPQEGDIVIEGKRGLDTFASTNLDFILRSKGISTIVLGGFL